MILPTRQDYIVASNRSGTFRTCTGVNLTKERFNQDIYFQNGKELRFSMYGISKDHPLIQDLRGMDKKPYVEVESEADEIFNRLKRIGGTIHNHPEKPVLELKIPDLRIAEAVGSN